MMKKALALLLASAMVLSLAACGNDNKATNNETNTETKVEADTETEPEPEAEPAGPVELNVTTTFAGEDGNAQNYKDAVAAWEAKTGNTVADSSATSDETFKTRVITDFETDSEPDVLFFFNGADSNNFIEAGKVVSLDEIRAEYPDFASNMDDGRMVPSLVDGKVYAIPLIGFWESMFVNTEVLDAAGVAVPGADYTWEQFLADCEKIKAAGYAPIAASLSTIPHYWWEFAIFNHTSPATHLEIPASVAEGNGQGWVDGINDIKALYEAGYFPENTLSATDDETFAMFMEGKAAFLVDGSWKTNGIVSACQSDPEDPSTLDTAKLDKFTVAFVPSTGGDRKATDIIGGISMGYFISRKAWDDPEKRAAAVDFVSYMTSNDVVAVFAKASNASTALNTTPAVDESQFNSLQIKVLEMMAECTSLTGAVQDIFMGECRVPTFDGMPEIVTGAVTAEDAVAEGFDIYNAQ